jgi:hypothetical protein
MPLGFHPLCSQGTIQEVIPWIDSLMEHELAAPDYLSCAAIHGTLKATPAALETLTSSFSNQDWNRKPAEGEWSPIEIICHLRDVDIEINVPRFEEIRKEDNLFVAGVDADAWVEQRKYHLEEGPASLESFLLARLTLLTLLKDYSDEDWNRTVRHSIFGPTSVHELTKFIAIHDRTHIRQVCDI